MLVLVTVDRGSYVLLLQAEVEAEVVVGKLGTLRFPAGYYAYCGSALKGLSARLARHARKEKKLHWHIDYLLPRLHLLDVWALDSPDRLECLFCRALLNLPGAMIPARGFGSSDCRCPAHLVHFPDSPSFGCFAEDLRLLGVTHSLRHFDRGLL
ncbi:MAG: GIY-YIG nuclease family protein [Chloroflexi bacterium]|nr:GIY-YIG nuclease family protein [Chloroflexota bacterium]